jgi:hypothetical protein
MKIALCPFFNNDLHNEPCHLPLGEATDTKERLWICPKHGLVGGDKIVDWEYASVN